MQNPKTEESSLNNVAQVTANLMTYIYRATSLYETPESVFEYLNNFLRF